jgi:hypothetical protein
VVIAGRCANSANDKGQPLNIPAYIENVFELLGAAGVGHVGEFYLDSYAGFVYYVPHQDETRETAVGHLPLLDHLISSNASSKLSFDGVTFEHTTWMRPSTTGFVEVQAGYTMDCAKNEPCSSYTACECTGGETPAALRFVAATGVTIKSCSFQHMGSVGVSFSGGSIGNMVSRCHFTDLSASAVVIGTRENPIGVSLAQQDHNNSVEDCTIVDVANEYRGHPAVIVGFSIGTTLAHNEIAFVPYTAISVGWGWYAYPNSFDSSNAVVGNHIHHHMQVLGDGGGESRS